MRIARLVPAYYSFVNLFERVLMACGSAVARRVINCILDRIGSVTDAAAAKMKKKEGERGGEGVGGME